MPTIFVRKRSSLKRRRRFAPGGLSIRALTAVSIETGSPVLGSPAFTQAQAFEAVALTVSSPDIGTPDIAQVHALEADALEVASPDLGAPALGQLLVADNLAVSSPTAGTPIIEQIHALAVDNIDIGSPVFGDATLSITTGLAADGIEVASPDIGAPAFAQKHRIIPVSVGWFRTGIAGSTSATWIGFGEGAGLGQDRVSQSFVATAERLYDITILGAKFFTVDDVVFDIYAADGSGFPTGSVLATSTSANFSNFVVTQKTLEFSGGVTLTVGNSYCAVLRRTGAPSSANYVVQNDPAAPYSDGILSVYDGAAWVAIAGDLGATFNIANSPVLGTPLCQEWKAGPVDIGSPVIGTPAIAQVHALATDAVEVGSPEFGDAEFHAGDGLLAPNVNVGSPEIGSPDIGQHHVIAADAAEVSSPVATEPDLSVSGPILDADDLAVGSPEIGSPDFAAANSLTASPAEQIVICPASQATAFIPLGRQFYSRFAQTFPASFTRIVDVRFWIKTSGNIPSDAIFAEIYAVDSADEPTGAAIITSSAVAGSAIGTTAQEVTFAFDAPDGGLLDGQRYAVVLRRTGAQSLTHYYSIGYFTSAPYPYGQFEVFTDEWLGTASDLWVRINGGRQQIQIGSAALAQTHAFDADDIEVASPVFTNPASNDALSTSGLTTVSPDIGLPALVRVVHLDVPSPVRITTTGSGVVFHAIGTPAIERAGQQFRATFPLLDTVTLQLQRSSSAVSSTVYAKIYERGIDGFPQGSPIATSQPVNATDVLVSPQAGQAVFDFGGATLVDGADYVLVVEKSGAPSQTLFYRVGYGSQTAVGGYPLGSMIVFNYSWAVNAGYDINAVIEGGVTLPEIGSPALVQVQSVEAASLAVSSPVLGTPAAAENYFADDLVVASPEFGAPAIGQLTGATDLAVASPVLGPAVFSQANALAADDLATQSPVIGSPGSHAVSNFDAVGLEVASPEVGTPAIVQRHALVSDSGAVGGPVFDAAVLMQAHFIGAPPFATGPPQFGTPTVELPRVLTAAPLTVASPTIPAAPFSHVIPLDADDLATASPAIGAPVLGQRHGMTGAALAVASPAIGAPTIGRGHKLAATIAVASPAIGAPAIGQRHGLTAAPLSSASPATGAPGLGRAHALAPDGLNTAPPAIGAPPVVEVVALDANGLTAAGPTAGLPAVGQGHSMAAGGIGPAAAGIGRPGLGQIHGLTADALTAGRPKIGPAAFAWGGLPAGRLLARSIRRVRFLLHHSARVRLIASPDARARTLQRPRPRVRTLGR